MNTKTSIRLKKDRDTALKRKHPWIFSGAFHPKELAKVKDGEIVTVLNAKKEFCAIGAFHETSIAIRILSFDDISIDDAFFYKVISQASDLRNSIAWEDTNAYRLFFGESDGICGLVIDKYADCLVVQYHQPYLLQFNAAIKKALLSIFPEIDTIYFKSNETLPKHVVVEDTFWQGSKEGTVINEYGLKFEVNWVTGQKTGFFIDQRENRKLLQKYSSGKKVLNTFCYSGGFSVAALNAGAKKVHSVDVSARAIELTDRNVSINLSDSDHASFAKDTFDFFKETDEIYDVIVLDPPAFAKHRRSKHNAVIGYKRLNTEAFKRISPGGVVFTFSCSQVIDKQLFLDTIKSAAYESNRKVQLLEYLGQPADHPVMLNFPEGEYIKGLVLKVL